MDNNFWGEDAQPVKQEDSFWGDDAKPIQSQTPVSEQAIEPPSMVESAARGAAQGAAFGMAPQASAVIESTLGSIGLVKDKTYNQALEESKKAYEAAQETNPGSYTAGEIAGFIGSVAAAGPIARAVSTGGKTVVGALGSTVAKTAETTGKVGEALVDSVATKLKVSPDTVKNVASLVADYNLGGPFASAFRILQKAGKVVRVAEGVTPGVIRATERSSAAESSVIDQISKRMKGSPGWDFPTKKK